jgi:hypothetical protein
MLSALAVLVIATSVIYGIVTVIGRDIRAAGFDRYKVILFGFHTPESVRRNIAPRFRGLAMFLFWARNVSLVLLIGLSVVEYLLR